MEIESAISDYIAGRAARGLRILTRREAMYNLIRLGIWTADPMEFMTQEEAEDLKAAKSLRTNKEVTEKEARKRRA